MVLRWLAQRVKVAAEVIDDINGAQIFHEKSDDVKRQVVLAALNSAILQDSARLISDLDELRRKSRSDAPNSKRHLETVPKGSV